MLMEWFELFVNFHCCSGFLPMYHDWNSVVLYGRAAKMLKLNFEILYEDVKKLYYYVVIGG